MFYAEHRHYGIDTRSDGDEVIAFAAKALRDEYVRRMDDEDERAGGTTWHAQSITAKRARRLYDTRSAATEPGDESGASTLGVPCRWHAYRKQDTL